MGLVWLVTTQDVHAQNLPTIKTASVGTLIERYAGGEGLSEWEIEKMKTIAWRESTYSTIATNNQYKGLFQIGYNEFRSCGYDNVYNAQQNIRCALKLFKKRGFQPWIATAY